MKNSFPRRIHISESYFIDAFKLENHEFFLFITVLDPKFQEYSWKEFSVIWSKKAAQLLPEGAVIFGVGGSYKTPQKSIPLSYLGKKGELWAKEGELFFKLKGEGVLNPGLFLDQKENRKKLISLIKKNKNAKNCLNLFSYTGAFSLCARSCGLETTSVDLSRVYLNWEKENHLKNFGNLEKVKLLERDAKKFLLKSKERYSVIVLDPPSFSRSKSGVMQVRKDLPMMCAQCFQLLEKNGVLLVSSNLSQWSASDFKRELFAQVDSTEMEKMIDGCEPQWKSATQNINSFFIIKK